MFFDGGYMGGMHGYWWLFWMLVVAATLFYGQERLGRRGNRPGATPQAKPHEVLRRRLASGEITPQQNEEHKALLDRDG